MTTTDLHAALLRPAVLQILRATGFSYAKPAVIDAITDFAARYLLLLGSSTAQNAFNTHNDFVPTIQDVRVALSEIGAMNPQMSTTEESVRPAVEIDGEMIPFEDMRGVEAFVNWAHGSVNKEIRRIAGFGDEIDVNEIAAGVDETEDYLTVMKKKHSKTAEESRYQGTTLGKDEDVTEIAISGGSISSLSDWLTQQVQSTTTARAKSKTGVDGDNDDDEDDMEVDEELITEGQSPASSEISSAPSSPEDAT